MKYQWAILLVEFDTKSKTHLCDVKHDKAPASAGASIVYSVVNFELPSATARQNDRFTLRKQFLTKVPFAV
jgi:hypothetical protein